MFAAVVSKTSAVFLHKVAFLAGQKRADKKSIIKLEQVRLADAACGLTTSGQTAGRFQQQPVRPRACHLLDAHTLNWLK